MEKAAAWKVQREDFPTALEIPQKRRISPFSQKVRLQSSQGQACAIDIRLEPHRSLRGRCSQCQKSAPGYDRLAERASMLWSISEWRAVVSSQASGFCGPPSCGQVVSAAANALLRAS
jgi:hypothetical protein